MKATFCYGRIVGGKLVQLIVKAVPKSQGGAREGA